MPSSMIFASLVVLWLLILVPAVARRRQEVARPSVAALSGRVLERPRPRQVPGPTAGRGPATGREREVHGMDETGRAARDERADDRGDHDAPVRTDDERDDLRWERPPARYRPGRGGFDPEAAALAARARYAFRQRVVLAMLIVAVLTGVLAAVALPGLWWPHAAVDVVLVGYLVYLRRQVRMEEAIRARRAARMAGTRRPPAADDPELDQWARRGRELTRRDGDRYEADDYDDAEYAHDDYDDEHDAEHDDAEHDDAEHDDAEHDDAERDDEDGDEDLLDDEPERVRGTGEPLRTARGRRGEQGDPTDGEPALPRLRPAPPPALPAGTSLLEVDEDDPDLYELDGPARPDYRRAAGE